MSWHEYMEAQRLRALGVPFYSLIMEAMAQADTANLHKLQRAWPDVWEETKARYNAPAGLLPDEPEPAAWALERYGLA